MILYLVSDLKYNTVAKFVARLSNLAMNVLRLTKVIDPFRPVATKYVTKLTVSRH